MHNTSISFKHELKCNKALSVASKRVFVVFPCAKKQEWAQQYTFHQEANLDDFDYQNSYKQDSLGLVHVTWREDYGYS